MRTVSLYGRIHPNQFEKGQAWLEEDSTQAETLYPTQCIRYAEINPGIPKLRYLCMSSAPISLRKIVPYPIPHQPAFGNTSLLSCSAHRTPELRIAELVGWGMTLTQKPRMCVAPEVRIANPCGWFRCIFTDHVQTGLRFEKDQACLEEAEAQPERGYPT